MGYIPINMDSQVWGIYQKLGFLFFVIWFKFLHSNPVLFVARARQHIPTGHCGGHEHRRERRGQEVLPREAGHDYFCGGAQDMQRNPTLNWQWAGSSIPPKVYRSQKVGTCPSSNPKTLRGREPTVKHATDDVHVPTLWSLHSDFGDHEC